MPCPVSKLKSVLSFLVLGAALAGVFGVDASPFSAGSLAVGYGLADEPLHCATVKNVCTKNSVHEEGNVSHFCIKVRVEEGRPKVDRANTCLYVTEIFRGRLKTSKLTVDQVKKILLDRIDAVFAQSERLLHYALTKGEQDAIKNQSCQALTSISARELCAFSGQWEAFIIAYAAWQETVRPRPTPVFDRILLNEDVEKYLVEIDLDSPLKFTDKLGDSVAYDGGTGLLFLRVADPIGDFANAEEYKLCISEKCDGTRSDPPRTVAAPDDIRKVLRPLKGKLWNKSEIVSLVQEYYAGKGLLATIEVGSAFETRKEITIKESPRLLSVNFSRDLARSTIDKAMYLLLPDRQFRRFRKCRADFEPAEGSADPRVVVEIKELMRTGTCSDFEESDHGLPYLNLMKLQLQKLQLNSIDLDVVVGTTTDEGEEYVFLQVVEVEEADKEEEKKGKNDKAVALPNDQGIIDPNLARPETQNSFAPRVTVEASPMPSPGSNPLPSPSPTVTPPAASPDAEDGKKKERKNYLGGGFDYRSGEGVRLIGIYQRSELLFGNDGFSLKVGGHDEPLGSVNYYADYVGFSRLGRRLTLQLTGSSELNAQRLFSGENTDERRTGALARAELELFRDRGGNQLRLSLEAQRMTVTLSQNNNIVGKQNLSTLDFGALYLLQPDYELDYPRWARLEPRLRFGLGFAQKEPRFNSFLISGNFHQKLSGFFEVDIAGRTGVSSRNTPPFELPTLGGTESVRGFRQDEAIGRRMWSLQNELWIPIPTTTNSAEELQRFLLRSVRLTAFADLGGVYQTVGSQPGLRVGPGAGVRFIFNPVVIKLDWAYGLTSADISTGRGRFSFSIGSNLPF